MSCLLIICDYITHVRACHFDLVEVICRSNVINFCIVEKSENIKTQNKENPNLPSQHPLHMKCLAHIGVNKHLWASLVTQWKRNRLPAQETRLWCLSWEDLTCRGAIKPCATQLLWARALEPAGHLYWSPGAPEPVFRNERGHAVRSPHTATRQEPPLTRATEKPARSEGPAQPKINKSNYCFLKKGKKHSSF